MLSQFRKKLLGHGDVFSGIKIKNKDKRQYVEAKRHNQYMDLMYEATRVMSGFPKPSPEKWAKRYAEMHGMQNAIRKIETILQELMANKQVSGQTQLYTKNKISKANVRFYQNALCYLNNRKH